MCHGKKSRVLTATLLLSHKQQDLISVLYTGYHMAAETVDTCNASIDIGQAVETNVTDMLRAYTTYFITVVATNGTGFNSGDSDPVQHTTPQTSMKSCLIVTFLLPTLCAGAAVAPSNISTTGQSSTVISVQWGGLSICTLVNGFIVRYRVQYSSQPNGTVQSIDQAVNQPGHWRNGADTSLTGLIPFTNYSIQVAAVNEDGEVGIFSDPITEQTQEDS